MKGNCTLTEWAEQLKRARRVAVFSHRSPDGDTIGSALSMRAALEGLGKEVKLVCDGIIPSSLAFLPGTKDFIRPENWTEWPFDTGLAVDVSTTDMLGSAAPIFQAAEVKLVLDHHETNPCFGDLNYIRGGESSCCLLVYEVLRMLEIHISREMGTCLLLGMSTDTGHFQFTNTSAATLRAAADLVEAGVNLPEIAERMYRTMPMRRMTLMQRAFTSLHFPLGGKAAVLSLTQKDFEETGAEQSDSDGFVNMPLEVESVYISVMLTEREGLIKASLRSKSPYVVNRIALAFGGGGHAQAAGCSLTGETMESAEQQILLQIASSLEGR